MSTKDSKSDKPRIVVVALLAGLVGALCRLGETEAATTCARACAGLVQKDAIEVLYNHILQTVETGGGRPN